ncbi:MAG: hypothetical protein E7423_01960 [Ruminococcaceae bacterium]|nr:hypothetical protein [Oscillospiraceae bacterium]
MIYLGRDPHVGRYVHGKQAERIYRGNNLIWPCPTLLTVHITSDLEQTLYITQSGPHSVEIFWGEWWKPEETYAGEYIDGVYYVTATHSYSSTGDYVIQLTPRNGGTWTPGGMIDAGEDSAEVSILGRGVAKEGTAAALTRVRLGDGITKGPMRNLAFAASTNLMDINISPAMTSIGRSLNAPSGVASPFSGCARLESITIPDTVDVMAAHSVQNCQKLKYAEIGAKRVLSAAFASNEKLEKVWIRDTVARIEYGSVGATNQGPFDGCPSSCVIYCESPGPKAGWDTGWQWRGRNDPLTVVYNQHTRPW